MAEPATPPRNLPDTAAAGGETPSLPDAGPQTRPVTPGLAAGRTLGLYRVERVLGAGGMGTVYLATDTQLGRQVAVKTLRPDLAADREAMGRFLREARATAAIEHEHVIPIYAVGHHAGAPYLVMPLLKGEALNARLQRGAWPELAEACRIGREVAAGLAAAHAAGLVHRDVKPSNVWLDGASGRAKLLDFGLARLVRGGDGLTRAGGVVGTPEYMSPEQAAGGAVDHRTDLFSLGVVLYELTTGRRPFTGDSVMAVLTGLAVHHPPPAHEVNPAVPVELSLFIDRLLAKSPDRRPGSAAEVCAALAAIESTLTPPAPAGDADPPAEGVDLYRVVAALCLASGGLSAGTTVFVLSGLLAPHWVGASLVAGVAALYFGLAWAKGTADRGQVRLWWAVWLGLGLGTVGPVVWGVRLGLGFG